MTVTGHREGTNKVDTDRGPREVAYSYWLGGAEWRVVPRLITRAAIAGGAVLVHILIHGRPIIDFGEGVIAALLFNLKSKDMAP
eukprot:1370743-Rhodomonas_salina.1